MENNIKQPKEKVIKKNKTRKLIVLIVSIIAAIVAYILFRGTYLETIEIGVYFGKI